MSHTDFKSLVADSEVIIVGTIKDITGYSTWDVPIQSNITVEIEDVIKGDVKKRDMLTYRELGGRMSAIEWVKANADKIKGKGSEKEYDETLASLKPTDIYEATVFGVENAEIGNRYLLFLRYDFINDLYLVVGMSCNGRFDYDDAAKVYFRRSDAEPMEIELSELKSLAETTPDNSTKLRAADEEGYRQYLAEMEKTADEDIKWDEITPKLPNPDYGKDGE